MVYEYKKLVDEMYAVPSRYIQLVASKLLVTCLMPLGGGDTYKG